MTQKTHGPLFLVLTVMLLCGGAFAVAAPAKTSSPPSPSAAERAWYTDGLEKLGFYVFPSPVEAGDFSVEPLTSPPGAKATTRSLSAERGSVVLLNFWATWCPPCRQEMPSIQRLADKLAGKAFTVMAISVGEERKTVADFIAREKFRFPVYLDRSGSIGAKFGARSIPTTYIVDKTGRIIAGYVGSREYDSPAMLEILGELARR